MESHAEQNTRSQRNMQRKTRFHLVNIFPFTVNNRRYINIKSLVFLYIFCLVHPETFVDLFILLLASECTSERKAEIHDLMILAA